MNEGSLKHGALSWVELMTPNVESAKKFYSGLFGWQIMTPAIEGMDYSIIKVNGDDVGGMMKTPPEAKGMPPCWSLYVTVDDVDATAAKVEELGGKICRPPMDIPEVGIRICVIQDPQGASLCIIKYPDKKP